MRKNCNAFIISRFRPLMLAYIVMGFVDIVGGAIIPPLMGVVNVKLGLMACLFIPVICLIYIFGVSILVMTKNQ